MDEELKTWLEGMRTEMRTEMADMRTEMAHMRTELRTEMSHMRTELRTEMADTRAQLRTETADTRAQLRTEMTDMRAEIVGRIDRSADAMASEMSIRFGEVNTKLTSIDQRLKLQAGLIQGGARAMARFSAFSEDPEERWVDLAIRMASLERVVDDLRGHRGAA